MKKVLVIALMLGAGVAFASTLGLPWFADNSPAGVIPPASFDGMSLVYLHNNHSDVLEVTISYYSQVGNYIGPSYDNTFLISPNASLAFRPVQDDAIFESTEALKIPNRPMTTLPPSNSTNDGKSNGSLVFSWLGPASYMSGAFQLMQSTFGPTSPSNTVAVYRDLAFSHLLPPGI